MRRLVLALLAALVFTGCANDPGSPGLQVSPPDIEVDTPHLRKIKARIGMDDCVPGTAAPVADGLPAITLACLGGGRDVDLATLRGPMVINLWQSFCAPCKKEMPALEEFHQAHGDRVPVLGIDYNDVRPEAALALAEETGATYPSLADPGGELMGKPHFTIRGLPAFLFLDAEGRVTATVHGGVESVDEVVALVREHLGVEL